MKSTQASYFLIEFNGRATMLEAYQVMSATQDAIIRPLYTDISKVIPFKKSALVAWKVQVSVAPTDELVFTFKKPFIKWTGAAQYLAPALDVLPKHALTITHFYGSTSSVRKISVGNQWVEFDLTLAYFEPDNARFKPNVKETARSKSAASRRKRPESELQQYMVDYDFEDDIIAQHHAQNSKYSAKSVSAEVARFSKNNNLRSTFELSDLAPPVVPSTASLRSPSKEGTRYPVWYATNRESIRDAEGRLTGFSAQLARTTSYGQCLVHIPEGHIIGQTQAGFWRRLLRTLTFRRDEQALRLVSIEPQLTESYWETIRTHAALWANDERCAVVFLHGYNVSFVDAAIRAAQIGFDLQVRGPVGFFSWPSKGSLLGYLADEASIEASEEAIMNYLRDFTSKCGAERVHVIAHSMGNRGLLRALQRILAGAAAGSPKLFANVILAAPDVDQSLFLSLADHYHRVAHRTTLYVSDKDRALGSSRMLRTDMARAGLWPPITIAPHIDTVHVANVDLTLLGHGYVAEARDVLTDMHQLIFQDAAPDARMGLRLAEEGGHRYWVISA